MSSKLLSLWICVGNNGLGAVGVASVCVRLCCCVMNVAVCGLCALYCCSDVCMLCCKCDELVGCDRFGVYVFGWDLAVVCIR